jgi:hypothetical protein
LRGACAALNINTTLVPDYAKGLAQENRDPADSGIDPAGGLLALSYVVLVYWREQWRECDATGVRNRYAGGIHAGSRHGDVHGWRAGFFDQ